MKELKPRTWYWLTNPQESDIQYPLYCNSDGQLLMDNVELLRAVKEDIVKYLREINMPLDEEKQERDMLQVITERDYWEEKATELANDIGDLLGFDVGEHSNANCPVQTAIDCVFEMTDTVTEALKASKPI